MIRTGRVVDKEQNLLKICFDKEEACSGCGMCSRQESTLSIPGDAAVGDVVEVALPDAQVLKASLVTYAIPLLGLIGGLWIGTELFPGREGMTLLTGLAGTMLLFAGVKLFDRKLRQTAAWQPRVIAVRPEAAAETEPKGKDA
ncbi:MAG: SoxR reducing system RseC family protein [Eubacteriales bacterium]|nr:SoxR reducing system RseC family protein [Eubacteriales bacterium]